MKNCDECGIKPANVHLTYIVQGQVSAAHLCEECARKKGIMISISAENVVAPGIEKKPQEAPDIACANCGMKFSEFRAQGWLGCARCYDAFEKDIDSLLMQMHGSNVHKGKRYCRRVVGGGAADIRKLRNQLQEAIKGEEFELAAALRDMIKSQTGGAGDSLQELD